ncbi:leucine-tRNA ligase, mitochondrial-like protein, partial [Euroglyphus maynei]
IFTPYPELFCTPKTFIGISRQHWLSDGKKHREIVGQIRNPFLAGERIDIRLIEDENFPPSTQATLFIASEMLPDDNKRTEVLEKARSMGLGGYYTSRSYRDWLISRQRFWGTPIPIVHCSNCGPVAVSDQDLPIQLPSIDYSKISSYSSNDISSPLKNFAPNDWLNVKCPKCQTPGAIRETDTCDTFFDSSWYFLRYFTDPSDKKPFDKIRLRPVDCYI